MQYWSKSAHAACQVVDKPIVYAMEDTGLWGEAVRQRQPIITNDYAAPIRTNAARRRPHFHHAAHEHPHLRRQHIVAIAGVGNKPTDTTITTCATPAPYGRLARIVVTAIRSELAAARDEAEAANQAKSRFWPHEPRNPTPMTAILATRSANGSERSQRLSNYSPRFGERRALARTDQRHLDLRRSRQQNVLGMQHCRCGSPPGHVGKQ